MRMHLRLIVAIAVLAAAFFLFSEIPVSSVLALPLVGVALLEEKRLSLTEAARRLNVSPSTVWRWAIHGVRGVKLETQVWGAKRYTDEKSLQEFCEACTAAANGESLTPQPRTPRQRRSDANRADAALAAEGI